MKTNRSRTKLKGKELTEASQTTKSKRGSHLRRLSLDSKIKTDKMTQAKSRSTETKKKFVDLLPDQQSEEELYYDFRPCCVKIRRLKSKETIQTQSEEELYYDFGPCCVKIRRLKSKETNQTQALNEVSTIATSPETSSKTNKKSQCRIRSPIAEYTTDRLQDQVLDKELCEETRPCCVKVRRLQMDVTPRTKSNEQIKNSTPHNNETSPDEIVDSTKLNTTRDSQVKTLKPRYIFRNPALALTARKAREKGLNNTLAKDPAGRIENTGDFVDNSTILFEPSKNLTVHAATIANPDMACSDFNEKVVSSQENEDNFSQIPHNAPSAISEVLLSEKHTNQNSNADLSEEKIRQPSKIKSKNQKKKSKIHRRNTKISPHNSENETDIYEFLSQSQTSGSESEKKKDPAADIIKKLIDQGKVLVTKNYKGKPIVNRKKIKRKPLTKEKNRQKNGKTELQSRKQLPQKHVVTNEYENDNEKHVHFVEDNENSEVIPTIPDVPSPSNKVKRKSNNATAPNQGTFSSLARSVLMQQTNHTNSARENVIDKERVLEITRRHFSTPFRKSGVSLITDGANLSPIPRSIITKNFVTSKDTSIVGMSSENNVSYRPSLPNEILDLPQADINSSYRPSLPDAILNLPHANLNTSYRNSLANEISNSPQAVLNSSFPNESISSSRTLRDTRQNLSLSSFSSNDSNAENMPPTPKLDRIELNDENALVFNARQTLNPRRTLSNRSPLKTINIIDVITLPPYKGPNNKDKDDNLKTNEEPQPPCDLEEFSGDDQSELHEELIKNNEESQALFGFEEYLHEDQNEVREELNNNSKNITNSSISSLHDQLKKLKKWRPNVPRYKDAKSSTITKRIFDDDFNQEKGQRDIRNMLCSTMINSRSMESKNTTISSALDSSDDSDEVLATTLKKNDAVDLFGDPESSFDQTRLHRTYERPFKRKRKLLHQYSVVLDSEDDSENEDDHNTSIPKNVKRQGKHTRQHQADKASNLELNKFISEFNSMIKEAEEYELIVT